MNCDMCVYRTARPGFEHRVGAPQHPHDHPHDPHQNHAHRGLRVPIGAKLVPESLTELQGCAAPSALEPRHQPSGLRATV